MTPLLVGLVAVTLLVSLLVAERRAPRAGRWTRRLALVVAVGALAVCAARPSIEREGAAPVGVLLTPGAGSLERETPPPAATSPVLALGCEPGEGWMESAERVASLAELSRREPPVDRMELLGYGLRSWDWQEPRPVLIAFRQARLDPGVSRIHWARELAPGEPLTIDGAGWGGAAVALLGPDGDETVSALANAGFRLQTVPHQGGRHLYHLALRDEGGRTLATEVVDVAVSQAPPPPSVLWLESSPRAETRHFKAWFSAVGGPLVVRSTVSRERRRTEHYNRSPEPVDPLTSELLESFDLVVIDDGEITALASAEIDALGAAVDEGLGALLLGRVEGRAPFSGFPFTRVEELEEREVRAAWPGQVGTPLMVTAVTIEATVGIRPLVVDESGRVLAGLRHLGRGQVAVSLCDGTYRWAQEGNGLLHRSYWTHVIARVARQRKAAHWVLSAGPVLVDQPLAITLETEETAPVAVVVGDGETEEIAPLEQHPRLPHRWSTSYWPRTVGWHRVSAGAGEPTAWFYAQSAASWRTWQQARAREETELALDRDRARAAETPVRRRFADPIRRWPFLAAALLSLSVLWADERVRARPGRIL